MTIYFAIIKLYCETQNCQESIACTQDSLSPTLFSVFLNDPTLMINERNLGISISGRNIGIFILRYADDTVQLAKDEVNLHKQLDILNNWCKKWRLNVNLTKSETIQFRKTRKNKLNIFSNLEITL